MFLEEIFDMLERLSGKIQVNRVYISKGCGNMEYSTHYDYYIKFEAVLDARGELIQYVVAYVSDNFEKISNIQPEDIVGKTITQIIDRFDEHEDEDFLCLKDIYNHIGPNAIRKFEKYMDSTDRWYLVNIFNREKNLLILYTDITVIKKYLVNISELMCDKTVQQYYKDGLTGLYTKDYFKVEASRLDTDRQLPLSIIIGDLNGLKLINDAFGYHMGDEAIKTAADILIKVFRKDDIISRFGGDEFVILLPQTSKSEALERIRQVKNKFRTFNLDFLRLTMTFGCATKEYKSENFMDIFKRAEEIMYFNKLKESRDMKMQLVGELKERLYYSTTETVEHHERLKALALIFGEEVGVSPLSQEELNILCEYHDIGSISIPTHIYNKQEKLRDDDWHLIKRHCEIGYHIIKAASFNKSTAEHILMHHERWDGKGYPRLLRGNEIPLVVRMFTIIDAYEAMVNHRPYRHRLSIEEALEEIADNSGTQFDPELVEVFVSLAPKLEALSPRYNDL